LNIVIPIKERFVRFTRISNIGVPKLE